MWAHICSHDGLFPRAADAERPALGDGAGMQPGARGGHGWPAAGSLVGVAAAQAAPRPLRPGAHSRAHPAALAPGAPPLPAAHRGQGPGPLWGRLEGPLWVAVRGRQDLPAPGGWARASGCGALNAVWCLKRISDRYVYR